MNDQLKEALRKIRVLEGKINTLTTEIKSLKTQLGKPGQYESWEDQEEMFAKAAKNNELVRFK